MHFDDRLATVLRLPATGDSLARVQYRQLVDLLGRSDSHTGPHTADIASEAFARIEWLSTRIPSRDRARLISEPPQPIINPHVVKILAEAEPDVAMAAIALARLSENDWLALIPELPVRARGILRHRRDLGPGVETVLERLGVQDRGLPYDSAEAPSETDAPEPESDSASLPCLDLELAEIFGEPLPGNGDVPARHNVTTIPQATPHKSSAPLTLASVVAIAHSRTSTPDRKPPRRTSAANAPSDGGIGAIVRRIEAFRQARGHEEPANSQNPGPAGIATGHKNAASATLLPLAIDFAADSQGRITWADGPHAPCVVGLDLLDRENDTSGAILQALRKRQPLRALPISLGGPEAMSGPWQIDATVRFDARGAYQGYCGRLRRLRPSRTARTAGQRAATASSPEVDRLREVLHELRTPANAIQVAAEIIQQQLYGPAPHEYRALAAAIAGDCAHILAGFEELDRLVKLETGIHKPDAGYCEFSSIVMSVVDRLRAWTDPRRSGFALVTPPEDLPLAIAPHEAEMLAWRLLAALAGATAPDEVLEIGWRREADGTAFMLIALPAKMAARPAHTLFQTPSCERGHSLTAGIFGSGFTLRLAAAQAHAAGGGCRRDGNDLALWLPGQTSKADSQNQALEMHSSVPQYS